MSHRSAVVAREPLRNRRVLFSCPGLSIHADAPLNGLSRANVLIRAGVALDVIGYPADYPYEGRDKLFRYISVYGRRSAFTRRGWDWLHARLGVLWTFIIEPFLVTRDTYRLARRAGYDLIWLHHGEPWVLWVLARWYKLTGRYVPTVVMITAVFFAREDMAGRPWKTRLRGGMNYRAITRLPNVMVTTFETPHIPHELGLDHHPRVRVIPEGHDNLMCVYTQAEARRQLGISPDERMLLLFGNASRAKGADLLLEALKQVPPTFSVYLVGQTGGVYEPSWGRVEELEPYGWSGRIKTVGRLVTGVEMDYYFAACDALVFPYRWPFIAVSSNLRQAAEHGKPVLATDQFHFHDLVNRYQTGLLFAPENIPALVHVLKEFAVRPPEWFQEIRTRYTKLHEDLGWDRIGQQYRELVEEMLALPTGRKHSLGGVSAE